MNLRMIALSIIVLSTIGTASLFALTWASLPERIATHFDVAGIADGWMSRQGFAVFYGVLFLFVVGMTAGIGWLLPRMPVSMINLPKKEYWLDDVRRASTFRVLQTMMLWIAAATSVLFVLLLYLTIEANQMADPRMPASVLWLILAGYLTAVVVPGIVLYVRMRRTSS